MSVAVRFDLSEVLPGCHVIAMDILAKIDAELKRQSLHQYELERLSGLSKNRISKWKNGEGRVYADQALRIAKVLRVPLHWLVDPTQTGPPLMEQPPLTEAEQTAVDLVRAHGYSKVLILRLLTNPRKLPDRVPAPTLGEPSAPVKPNRRKG
jgi:transcriptional regulator with XRE-family HTH domain